MRLVGRDAAAAFRRQHRQEPWLEEIDALLCELEHRVWSSIDGIITDFPKAVRNDPLVIFALAGGAVQVTCEVICDCSVILLRKFVLRTTMPSAAGCYISGNVS